MKYDGVAAQERAWRAAWMGLCAVYLLHAVNYLYFFVDDEGIPFVFARHLLQGKGLVYNSFEGRVEGYSDFLHVLLSAVWLQASTLLGLGALAPFFIGKAVSLASGAGTVLLAGRALGRLFEAHLPGRLAGLAFLVLFPPLAMWSCSSLETSMVTLLVTTIVAGLLEDTPGWDGLIAGAACALVLLRIDGFVFVGGLLVPALAAAGPERRQRLTRTLVVVGALLVAYHAWRVWYFGRLLPVPLEAKVLYKLHPVHDLVTRQPLRPYGLAMMDVYWFVPAAVGLGLLVIGALRFRRAWPLLVSAIVFAGYAATVGDWMAGFRFFVPLGPIAAVLVALAISSIRRSAMAWSVTAVAMSWFAVVAVSAATHYDRLEYRTSWWRHPSADSRQYFGPYIRLYDDLVNVARPGMRTAYDQAGFIPYMLDLDNFDQLGICSPFIAGLPVSDFVFTEVGRYSPLTNKTALRAAQAYMLYLGPELLIEPLDNLRAANRGVVPPTVLRGHYALMFEDPSAQAAVYRRKPESLQTFRASPTSFLENLASPSRIKYASDGEAIARGQFLSRLRFLADGTLDRRFTGRVAYDVVFGDADEAAYELHVHSVWTLTPVTMTITLRNRAGAIVVRDERVLAAGARDHVSVFWPDAIQASQLSLEFVAADAREARVILQDLRVQGQSPALAAYVAHLAFPPRR